MITFLLTNLIDGRVIYVSMPEEEYKEKFLMGNTSFSSDWYYEPEESENVGDKKQPCRHGKEYTG